MANGVPPLDVGRLRLLREVGLRGSIAAAARGVGLTPSAVSQQLAQLERDAGAALVERSSRGVVLTAAGHALAERATEVLEVLAAARGDLDRLTGSLTGRVRLAAVASAAATFVSTAVDRVPDGVEVDVRAVEPERGIGLLLTGDADVAVVDEYDHVPLALPEGFAVRDLGREPLVLVRRAGDTARRTIAALASADWVMPPEDAACGRAVRAACRVAGFEPRVRWETDDMLLLSGAVADGHGVALLPRRAVTANPAAGARVHVSRPSGPGPTRGLLAVARPSVARRPVAAAVLDALVAAARGDAGGEPAGHRSGGHTGARRARPVGRREVGEI